jgi:SHS2 domain-containing protein
MTAAAAPAGATAPGWTLLPHTADLRLALRARTLTELYAVAAAAFRQLLVGSSPVQAIEERQLDLPAAEPERFFRFVRELLYLYDAEGFLPAEVVAGPVPRVRGERFDPQRHVAERQVKALTRHGFDLRHDAAGYRAELLLDV